MVARCARGDTGLMKAETVARLKTYRKRARTHLREIAVASVLTLGALGFVVAAIVAPAPSMTTGTGQVASQIDTRR